MRYEFHPEAEQEFIVLAVPSVLSVLSKLSEESFCPGFGRQPYWLWRRKLEEVIGGPGSRATSFVPWARIRAATVKERPPNFSSATQLRSAHPTVWGGEAPGFALRKQGGSSVLWRVRWESGRHPGSSSENGKAAKIPRHFLYGGDLWQDYQSSSFAAVSGGP